jgi:hypothetical protein
MSLVLMQIDIRLFYACCTITTRPIKNKKRERVDQKKKEKGLKREKNNTGIKSKRKGERVKRAEGKGVL